MLTETPVRAHLEQAGNWRRWAAAPVLAAACVPLGAAVLSVLLSFGPSEAGIQELKAEGQALIDGVERYRVRTGHYPTTLEEAGLSAPWTWYGRWRYGSDRGSFFVEVGAYANYGFLLFWTEEGWSLDQ